MDMPKVDLSAYLRDVLHTEPALEPWARGDGLPACLTARYAIFDMCLLGTRCLVMCDRTHGEATPAEIAKHAGALNAAKSQQHRVGQHCHPQCSAQWSSQRYTQAVSQAGEAA